MKIKVKSNELTNLVSSLSTYDKRCNIAFGLYASTKAKDLEGTAKKNAKWIDRTGQARRSIKGRYRNDGDKFRLILEGYAEGKNGDDYFKYLENYHQKKNAILQPTIEENADEVLEEFVDILTKIKL